MFCAAHTPMHAKRCWQHGGGPLISARLPAPTAWVQLSNAQLRNLKSIEGEDFTDALMRKDVQMSLCKIARGVNPKTGVATADSLGCP